MSDHAAWEFEGFPITEETLTREAFVWESRVPGEDADTTWEDGHEHLTLAEAVHAVLPFYAEYGLTPMQAAHLALRTGLVLETGVSVEEWRAFAGDVDDDAFDDMTDDPAGL